MILNIFYLKLSMWEQQLCEMKLKFKNEALNVREKAFVKANHIIELEIGEASKIFNKNIADIDKECRRFIREISPTLKNITTDIADYIVISLLEEPGFSFAVGKN